VLPPQSPNDVAVCWITTDVLSQARMIKALNPVAITKYIKYKHLHHILAAGQYIS